MFTRISAPLEPAGKDHGTTNMSRIPPPSLKKRKLDDAARGKTLRPKRTKVQRVEDYHSSSDESDGDDETFAPVNLGESEDEGFTSISNEPISENRAVKAQKTDALGDSDDHSGQTSAGSDEESGDEGASTVRLKNKRNDPEAFSTSISKILSTKLSQSARQDPVLSRSRQAAETSSSLANERLEKKARAKLRAEKREELERGRVRDVLGIQSGTAGEVAEEEKRLRKVAQRGVVALFNAFRSAQMRMDQAAKEEQKKGTVGINNREGKVKEMSKQGFLELINGQSKNKGS